MHLLYIYYIQRWMKLRIFHNCTKNLKYLYSILGTFLGGLPFYGTFDILEWLYLHFFLNILYLQCLQLESEENYNKLNMLNKMIFIEKSSQKLFRQYKCQRIHIINYTKKKLNSIIRKHKLYKTKENKNQINLKLIAIAPVLNRTRAILFSSNIIHIIYVLTHIM